MNITIWYNPHCGTCQKVRSAVEAKGYTPRLIEYLKTPPSVNDIDDVCRKAGIEPQDLARKKEPVYAEVAARCRTRREWIEALHDHPVLIERPVVIVDGRAIVARPPEKLQDLWLE